MPEKLKNQVKKTKIIKKLDMCAAILVAHNA